MAKVEDFSSREALQVGAKVKGGHKVVYASEDKEFMILLTRYGKYQGFYLEYHKDGAHIDEERTPRPSDETAFDSLEACKKFFKIEEESDSLKQYNEFKGKHPDALMLLRCGDYYKCYEEDAEKASGVLGITLVRQEDRKIASFPFHALDTYLPKLVRAGYRIAICDQLEDPKLTKKLVKKGITELVEPKAKIVKMDVPDNGVEMLSITDSTGTQEGMRRIISDKCKELGKTIDKVSIWQHNGNGDYGIAVAFNRKEPVAVAPWERTRTEKVVTYQFLSAFTEKYDSLRKRVK